MDEAPTDGSRILIKFVVFNWIKVRGGGFRGWEPVGTEIQEGRYFEGKWSRWCGTPRTSCTSTDKCLGWWPHPEGDDPVALTKAEYDEFLP